jgi:upstream activation factor subunit UAF30
LIYKKLLKVNHLPIYITMPAKKTSAPKTPAKKTSGKKSTPKKVAAPVAVPEVVAAPATPVDTVSTTTVETTTTEISLLDQIESDFASLNERLGQFKTMYASITTDLRKLQKNMARHVRENSRKRKRKAPSGDKPKRAPSGFAKPALISKELCSFLGQPEGTEMARTEVTKHLTSYIKEHNLQDSDNKRKIIPDAKLKKLLNVQPSDEVTYFNLQRYMKVHFPKSAAAIAADAATAAATASA